MKCFAIELTLNSYFHWHIWPLVRYKRPLEISSLNLFSLRRGQFRNREIAFFNFHWKFNRSLQSCLLFQGRSNICSGKCWICSDGKPWFSSYHFLIHFCTIICRITTSPDTFLERLKFQHQTFRKRSENDQLLQE